MAIIDSFEINSTAYDLRDAGAVLFAEAQNLTAAQKQQARENIGANDIDAYTKAETDALLDDKADAATTLAGYGITDAYTKAEAEALRDYVLDMSPVAETSGAVVAIDDAAPLTAERVVINIELVQSGSGDPSPDNVRPISGWAGANVSRTGVNIADLSDANISQSRNSTKTASGNGIAITSTGSLGRIGFLYRMKPNTTYTVSYKASSTGVSRVYYGTEDSVWSNSSTGFIFSQEMTSTLTSYSRSITTQSNGLVFIGLLAGSENNVLTITDFQIELGSTASSYTPYVGQTYPISWQTEAGTVYGGTLDVTNGTLTVDRAEIASYNGETLTGEWISDRDVYTAGATPTIGAQVVYKLSAPVTYQLTSYEILLFRGANTIYADAGNTTMTYRQDVSILLGKLAAQVAALNAAVANS